jgi:hypothetical protein
MAYDGIRNPVSNRRRRGFAFCGYRYTNADFISYSVSISQAAEIPNKVKAEITAILRDAGAPV